uniref:Putative secreted protein n=1 Tax=Ixodes ricinus TaxID=34613 RepID=A0A6B0U4M9_IXORI
MRSISCWAALLLRTTHTSALTVAYSPSTSCAMATRPRSTDTPPMFSRVRATGRGMNVRAPRYPMRTPPRHRAGPAR